MTPNTHVTADRTWLVVIAVSALGCREEVHATPMLPEPAR
jgi:hypothetical protein